MLGKGIRGVWDITRLACSGVKFPRGIVGDRKVVDLVMLVTLITGPLTKEMYTITGTSSLRAGMLWESIVSKA
jgi:hypothetical protein